MGSGAQGAGTGTGYSTSGRADVQDGRDHGGGSQQTGLQKAECMEVVQGTRVVRPGPGCTGTWRASRRVIGCDRLAGAFPRRAEFRGLGEVDDDLEMESMIWKRDG